MSEEMSTTVADFTEPVFGWGKLGGWVLLSGGDAKYER